MTVKRLLLALPVLALLAACGGNAPEDGRAASGEVLEGTISDAMLPTDRVRSEPPLEDPEAFAKARSTAGSAARTGETAEGEEEGEQPAAEGTEAVDPAAIPAPVAE